MTIAIIGAGIAGAAAARHLGQYGLETAVFDKGRGVGGRLATRRDAGRAYDHGAPFVSASGGHFARFLHECVQNGTAAVWGDRGVEARMIGLPGMSAIARSALSGAEVRPAFEVAALERDAAGWTLVAKDGDRAAGYEAVLVTVPSPQAAPLLRPVHTAFAEAADDASYSPCWTLMMAGEGIDAAMAGTAEDALAADGIAMLVPNGAKSGRGADTLVAHAGAAWSQARLEDERPAVAADLAALVCRRLGLPEPEVAMAHRWRFARLARVSGRGPDYDADAALGIAGDWCLGPDAEDAFHAGTVLAAAVVRALAHRRTTLRTR